MISFVTVLDLVGTFAFAVSGIRLAASKEADWFGAFVVGAVTAVGGGTIRDLLLDTTPVWMTNPMYLVCIGFALLWVITADKTTIRRRHIFFVFDTIGLALFTITGVSKSLDMGFPYYVAIIMGCLTGAGGGMIRDVLLREIPYILKHEIYATACIIGGIVYMIGEKAGADDFIYQLTAGISVFLIRLIATRYNINLPVIKQKKKEKDHTDQPE